MLNGNNLVEIEGFRHRRIKLFNLRKQVGVRSIFLYAESQVKNGRIGSANDAAVQEVVRERGFDKGYEAKRVL